MEQLQLMLQAAERRVARQTLMHMHTTTAAIALCFGQDKPAKAIGKELGKLGRIS